jgi:hypothetical protein
LTNICNRLRDIFSLWLLYGDFRAWARSRRYHQVTLQVTRTHERSRAATAVWTHRRSRAAKPRHASSWKEEGWVGRAATAAPKIHDGTRRVSRGLVGVLTLTGVAGFNQTNRRNTTQIAQGEHE